MSQFLKSLIVALFLSQTWAVSRLNRHSDKRNTNIQVRNSRAKESIRFMNLEIDPCQDFYEYACGNWSKYYPPPANTDLTVNDILQKEVLRQLQVILDGSNFARDSQANGMASNFYKSCLAYSSTISTRRDFLIKVVNELGGIPGLQNDKLSLNWLFTLVKVRLYYGVDALIGVEINKNLHTGHGNSIYLTEPKTTLIPAELCSAIAAQQADVKDQPYATLEQQVSANMVNWLGMTEEAANLFAGDIVSFEFQLCKKMRTDHTWREEPTAKGTDFNERRNVRGKNRLYGNRDTTQLYPRQSTQFWSESFDSTINFKYFINSIFQKNLNEQVYMTSEAYFQQLARVIKMSGFPSTSNYIIYRALMAINFPTPDTMTNRPKYCTEFTLRYFPKVVGAYLQKFYRGEVKQDIEVIFRQIKDVLEDSVKADWMDENTKNAAVQKLIAYNIGFPVYENLELIEQPIERLDYWHKLKALMFHNSKTYLNRFYNSEISSATDNFDAADIHVKLFPANNDIIIGWGALQSPFYNYLYPNSLKFSGLAQQIARELTLAFDEQGWHQNSLSPQRFDEYTIEGFRNQSNCFHAQYSNYLYNNPEIFRNASKIREIMADSSGLNIAFKAYLKWLESIEPIETSILMKETLPELNFTNTQLFFINFAQSRCAAKSNQETPPDFLPISKHTAEKFEVNGPLSNNLEFAKEFGCSRGTEMNPDDKCALYN